MGANGIGLEICRQLAGAGVTVVLTARDEERGRKAVEQLRQQEGFSDDVVFHQLDVADPASVASLAEFVGAQFGKLDILVNNAAVGGIIYLGDAIARASEAAGDWPSEETTDWNELASQNYELAEECLQINYYGAQKMFIPNEWAKGVLNDEESLTEERVDEVIKAFLTDFKHGSLKEKGWPVHVSAYKLSKSTMNAYTRILARKYPNILVNSVHPGFCRTDITSGAGVLTAAGGAEYVVRVALDSTDGPSGLFFHQKQVSSF